MPRIGKSSSFGSIGSGTRVSGFIGKTQGRGGDKYMPDYTTQRTKASYPTTTTTTTTTTSTSTTTTTTTTTSTSTTTTTTT